MHDPTEGGLSTGLAELAEAAGVGLEIDEDALPILPETRALCAPMGLDPLGLIASGALLLAVAPEDSTRIAQTLEKEGIPTARVGRVVSREKGLTLEGPAKTRSLPRFARDEIARLFE